MKPDLDKLRESGRISALARETCKKMIVPGARIGESTLLFHGGTTELRFERAPHEETAS